MITNDYLVIEVESQKEVLIEDSITAEDSVVSAFGEAVLFMTGHFNFCYFEGLSTGKKFLAIKLSKIFMVKVKGDSDTKEVFSSVEGLNSFLRKYPDEDFIVESKYLDDPRNLRGGIPEDEKIYRVTYCQYRTGVEESIFELKKDYYTVSIVNKIFLFSFNIRCYIVVSAKDTRLALEKARKIFEEKDPFKKNEPFKSLVMKFHEVKNCIFYYYSGVELLNKKDFENISKMEESECRAFLSQMNYQYQPNYLNMRDADLCIFCFKYFSRISDCLSCPYAVNHDITGCITDSPYDKIVKKMGVSGGNLYKNYFVNLLIRETINKFDDLLCKE